MVQKICFPSEINLPKSEYDVINSLIKNEIDKRHNNEIMMFNDILKAVLGRETNVDDFKKIRRVYTENDPTAYWLYFNDKCLGRVRFKMHPIEITSEEIKPEFWSLEFIPDDFSVVNAIKRYIG